MLTGGVGWAGRDAFLVGKLLGKKARGADVVRVRLGEGVGSTVAPAARAEDMVLGPICRPKVIARGAVAVIEATVETLREVDDSAELAVARGAFVALLRLTGG